MRASRRTRWDPVAIEAIKLVIADIPKREHPPQTLRVSYIPMHRGYAELRVYQRGRPTGRGLVIHRDLLPAVLTALSSLSRKM